MTAIGKLRFTLADDSGNGLTAASSKPALQSAAPCEWEISQAKNHPGWFRVRCGSKFLDLTNPEQEPVLNDEQDCSGQYWKFEAVNGCKSEPGGPSIRMCLGYNMTSMWTGGDKLLTGEGGSAVTMKELDFELGNKQVWDVRDSSGNFWTPPVPEVVSCDFGTPVEVISGEPEVISCDFGRVEPVEAELVICGGPMICGGLAPASEGGPVELLSKVRAEAEARHGKAFTVFEPVQNRTQVVAGTNHYCKVRIGDDEYAHFTIWEQLGDAGPMLTGFEAGKTMADSL